MQCMAPWVPIFKSSIAQDPNSFIPFTLGTINSKTSKPQVRTCIYRGFLFDDENTNCIICTTDNRSQKFDDLLNNDNFESCFYFRNDNKQFRLSGKCGLISFADLQDVLHQSDNTEKHSNNTVSKNLFPKLKLPDLINKPYEDDNGEVFCEEEQRKHSMDPIIAKTINNSENIQNSKAEQEIIYPLFSPSSLEKIQKEIDQTYQSLNEVLLNNSELLYPPTIEDYRLEFNRLWSLNNNKSKSRFKLPKPRSLITVEKRKLLDRISRGVDGTDVNLGIQNFAVMVLFIDKVDYYIDSYGNSTRCIFERINFDQWKETDVVP